MIGPFRGYNYFLSCDLDLGVWPIFWNFLTLLITFEQRVLDALKFHMSIPCDKSYVWVLLFLTLWPWPWSLTHFLNILTLPITFEQWVLELWYFTWIFPVIRPFLGYHYFLPCYLDLGVLHIFEIFNLGYNFWTVGAIGLIFHMRPSMPHWFESYVKEEQEERQKEREEMKNFREDMLKTLQEKNNILKNLTQILSNSFK